MSILTGGGGVTSRGFTLGPEQNIFSSSTKSSAETLRDNYASANPSWLSQYNSDTSLNIILEYTNAQSEPVAEYQVRNSSGTNWSTNSSVVAVKGDAGSSTNFQFKSETERDNFFNSNLDLLEKDTPIVVTLQNRTVVNQVWEGLNNPPSYDNSFWTTASVKSGVASFEWGDNHKASSVGENIIFKNNISDFSYFPAWQGTGDHSTPAGRVVFNRATTRVYTYDTSLPDNGLIYLEPVGSVAPTGSVPYDVDVVLTVNEAVFGLKIVSAENYTGRLDYTITRTPSQTETYAQSIDVSLVEGQELIFWFEFQSELMKGDTFTAKFTKEDKTILNVRPSLTIPTAAYVEVRLREFEDKQMPIVRDLEIKPKSSDFVAENGKIYAVNTTNGVVNVDAGTASLYTFAVFDSHEKFNSNDCVINFGGGNTFILDTRNDYFRFFKDENESWRFQEIDQDNGGDV